MGIFDIAHEQQNQNFQQKEKFEDRYNRFYINNKLICYNPRTIQIAHSNSHRTGSRFNPET